MTRTGHYVVGIAVGALILRMGYQDSGNFLDLMVAGVKWMIEGVVNGQADYLYDIRPFAIFIGVLLGANAPNWFEKVYFIPGQHGLYRDRGLYHLPWVWGLVLAAGLSVMLTLDNQIALFGGAALMGVGIGALTHVICDWLSLGGIPIWNPKGEKKGAGLYVTGTFREFMVIVGLMSVMLGIGLVV